MRHSMKPDLRADYKIRLYTASILAPKTRSSRCPVYQETSYISNSILVKKYLKFQYK